MYVCMLCYVDCFQNDIWAETKYMGFHISYFACRNGAVYNVSDWIMCQVLLFVTCTPPLRHVAPSLLHWEFRIQLT